LANEAIRYISDQKSAAPDKPFFLYFSTGAGHEPHQVSQKWIDKYKGKFDQGWDKYREDVLKNQIKLGVVPAGTKLAPRNPDVKAWNSLSADEKKLYTRFIEVYAGFISQTDYEVGRIIDFIEQIGQLDNTLVIVLVGDNGSEGAGGDLGSFLPNAPDETREQILDKYVKNLNLLGTEKSAPNYPAGWAAATNTPFRYYKGYSIYEGGTHDPLIIFYPKKIKDKGGIRHQYSYVNDILPTTLELVGAKIPAVINGYKQEPVEGVSLAYTTAAENKDLPERHTVQYHEMTGSYAIYKDGWKASFPSKNDNFRKAWSESERKIQLYHVKEDFNELNDLSAKYPEKVKELANVFDIEAKKYNVYPLKETWGTTNRNIYDGKNKVVLYPGAYLTTFSLPYFLSTDSHSILADVEIRDAREQGVLISSGGFSRGFSLYVKNNKLSFAYNAEGKIVELTSNRTISSGKQQLKAEIRQVSGSRDKTISLYINGEKVAERKFESGLLPRQTESLDVGKDLGTTVSEAYESPFTFTGKINQVTLESLVKN
jgi:arylsulfatase